MVSAFSYAEPDTLLTFSNGSGANQVGLSFEDVPLGPYRLACVGSTLYLLDQLNSRVLCYDTSGNYLREIKTPFKPWDMAVDDPHKLYLLDNRSQPAKIAVIKDGIEVERISIAYDFKEPLTAIVSHPPDSLLAISGTNFYAVVRDSPNGLGGGNPCVARLKALDPDSIAGVEVSGIRYIGLENPVRNRKHEILLAYGSGRVWIGSEEFIQDKSGSFYSRDILVLSDSDEDPAVISLPVSFYDYDTDWRNVTLDQWGNIYAFTSFEEGKAAVLRWRAVY